jgi:hypothetical protein
MQCSYRIFIIFIVLFLGFLSINDKTCAKNVNNPDAKNVNYSYAKKILKKVESKYSKFKFYKDIGVVKTKHERIEFETWFSRPDSFLMKRVKSLPMLNPLTKEYKTFKFFSSILCNDNSFYIIKYKNGYISKISKKESMRSAIISEIGTTFGAVKIISGLLINNLDFWKVTEIENPILKSYTNEQAGAKGYILCGNLPNKEIEYCIWVDKNYYIKKIIRNSRVGQIKIEYTKVKSDIEIDNQIFLEIEKDVRGVLRP